MSLMTEAAWCKVPSVFYNAIWAHLGPFSDLLQKMLHFELLMLHILLQKYHTKYNPILNFDPQALSKIKVR